MRRLVPSIAALVVALAGTAAAAQASEPVFTVVPTASAITPFASAETPNPSGGPVLPPSYLTPRQSAGLPFPALHGLWQKAGATYGIPWQVLAAINKVESNFGRNMGPSSAGAIGWMQFMPSTWLRWGMDGDGDGVADPWNPPDAIFSAARYLAAAGGRTDLQRGIFAYNHAQWYVDQILDLARLYGQNGVDIPFTYDKLQVDLQKAERTLARQNQVLVRATLAERRLARRSRAVYARADDARLLSDRLALQKRAFQWDSRRAAAAKTVVAAKRKLKAAEKTLTEVRSSSWTSSFAPGGATLLAAPQFQGDFAFPVGGGPSVVSVGHFHHDYPAADIAAPTGSPVYAITDGIVLRGWHAPEGRCGIGFTMRAIDGRDWTFCHLSYLEPTVSAGTALSAGSQVGLVGSTGTSSSGPHLHLQLAPPVSYPQAEAWFQSFAGSAFSWIGPAPTQAAGITGAGSPVFAVVPDDGTSPSTGDVLFTKSP